jgi:hypothetical protein
MAATVWAYHLLTLAHVPFLATSQLFRYLYYLYNH